MPWTSLRGRVSRPPSPAMLSPPGRRAHSKITVLVDTFRDGDPWVLARRLAVELDALVALWRRVAADSTGIAGVEVLRPGDSVSAQLPTIGTQFHQLTGARAVGDPRFTVGLALDVARVLERHGYEALNGGQVVELQSHLFLLLHGDPDGSCTGRAR